MFLFGVCLLVLITSKLVFFSELKWRNIYYWVGLNILGLKLQSE